LGVIWGGDLQLKKGGGEKKQKRTEKANRGSVMAGKNEKKKRGSYIGDVVGGKEKSKRKEEKEGS